MRAIFVKLADSIKISRETTSTNSELPIFVRCHYTINLYDKENPKKFQSPDTI